jgi:hypothetical protein
MDEIVETRLQGRILECVHKNQYGFIRNRSIHDCICWSFEYLHLCHTSNKPIIILKLGFAKSFDTIENEAIIQVLNHMGFNQTWLDWWLLCLPMLLLSNC